MLKIILVLLIVINGALAALMGGALDAWIPSGHEPQRLQQQIHPEKLRKLDTVATRASPPVVTIAPPLSAPAAVACVELGDFNETEATRLEKALAELVPTEKITRRRVTQSSSFMVYIPSQGDKDGADRKSGELRRLGVSDFYVLQADGDMRFAISLGIFKTRAAADGHLAELVKKGVRSARITGRGDSLAKVAFQLRGLDDQAVADAVKLAKTEQHDCAPL